MRATVACVFLLTLSPTLARAEVSDVHPIDGPSADIVEVADAAMAEDGTAAIVYLKKVGGHNHVFVVPFGRGNWGAPERVDAGQEFDSSWPQVAAGDSGRLLVTWVQEFGVGTDRMFSASRDPGASGFHAPVPVDFNVGEATATFPSLAMNQGGQAYLSYLVVTDTSTANPPGYVGGEVRLARYNGLLWSSFGSPIDRNPATPLLLPTAATAPQVGIDLRGNAIVAWQEPDDEFVNRIWARRAFSGGSVGVPLQVSPSIWEGGPVRGPADAFGLDVSGFGQAAIAFRQQPGQSGKLTAPRLFVDEIGDAFTPHGASFEGARLLDGGVVAGVGTPAVGVEPNGAFAAAFAAAGATSLIGGDPRSLKPPQRIDEGGGSVSGDPLVDLSETGASVTAWREQRGGAGLVGVREGRADGVAEPGLLTLPRGGPVAGLQMGGSGLGDAILGWAQPSSGGTQVAGAIVDAPPDPFLIEAPEGWVRAPKLTIHWAAATNAISGVVYSVSIDDEPIGKTTRRLVTRVLAGKLDEGQHRVQVFAIDDEGQQTGSRNATIRIDRKPPRIALRHRGSRVVVVASDGSRRGTSGVKGSSVKVAFGDGSGGGKKHAGGGGGEGTTISRAPRMTARRKHGKPKKPIVKRVSHDYERAGSYTVQVTARDRAGNVAHFKRRVRVG
jgi:hypothetical protein